MAATDVKRVHRQLGADGAATWAFVALASAAALLLLYAGRHLGFFFDEWNFVLDRRSGGIDALLQPHNGHFVFLPAVIYRLLLELFGLDSYLPYRIVVIALHVAAGTALYLLARRRVGAWAALVPAALLLFLGSAYENLLWPFQTTFVGAMAFGLLALVALDRRSRGGDVAAALLLLAATACSSVGVPFVAAAFVELVLPRQDRRRLWVALVPGAVFGLWYLAYSVGSEGGESLKAANVLLAPQYVADAAAAAAAGIAGLALVWGPVLLATGAIALWSARRAQAGGPAPLTPRLAALATAALVNWGLTALARADVGEPASSRYVYAGAVWLLLIGVELLRPPRRDLRVAAVATVLTAAAVLSNIGIMREGQRNLRSTWETVRASLSAIEVAGDRAPEGLQPDPQRAPQITAGRYDAAVEQFGSPALTPEQLAAEPGPLRELADGVLAAAEPIATAPVAGDLDAAGSPLVVDAVPAGRTRPWRGACLRLTPAAGQSALELSVRPGGAVELRGAAGAAVDLRVRRFGDGFAGPAVATVPAGAATRVVFPAPDGAGDRPWHLRLSSTAAVSVCPD